MGTACSALHGSHGERVIKFRGGGRDASTRLRRRATGDERDIVNHAVLLEGQRLDTRRLHSCEIEISLQALPMLPILVRTPGARDAGARSTRRPTCRWDNATSAGFRLRISAPRI